MKQKITFLMQGAYDKINTPIAASSIRKYFPYAKIILSTWEGTEIPSDLNVDECLFCEDPGGFRDNFVDFTNNLARQLVSSQRGLEKVNTEYTVKMRTDIAFYSDSVLRLSKKFLQREKNDSVFNQKIIIPTFFTKRFLVTPVGGLIQPTPFHFSDWFCYGLTDDVRKFYSAPIPKEPYQSVFFTENQALYSNKVNLMGASHRYAPEQYIAYWCYRKYHSNPVQFDNYMDFTDELIQESDKFLVSNFLVYSPKSLGFYCLKEGKGGDAYRRWSLGEKKLPYLLWNGLVREYVYQMLYKKYCDFSYSPSLASRVQEGWERIVIGRLKKCLLP